MSDQQQTNQNGTQQESPQNGQSSGQAGGQDVQQQQAQPEQQQRQPQNQGGTQQNQTSEGQGGSGSSTGLEENVAGALAYAFGFITGVIFLVIEEDSNFVKFHAIQSIITSLSLYLIFYILGWIPLLGIFISFLMIPFIIAVILFLIYKAYKGKMFKLPIIGDIAEDQL